MDKPAKNGPVKLLFNRREAAACLGISERTLWTLTKSGEIPSLNIRSSVRYPIESLKKWIDEQQAIQKTKNLPK
jgi:excisionase family DNA binding protein